MCVHVCLSEDLFFIIFSYVYVCLFEWGMCNMGTVPLEVKGVGSLELELQVVVSHLTWVLETEPRSSGRALLTAEPFLQPQNIHFFYFL